MREIVKVKDILYDTVVLMMNDHLDMRKNSVNWVPRFCAASLAESPPKKIKMGLKQSRVNMPKIITLDQAETPLPPRKYKAEHLFSRSGVI